MEDNLNRKLINLIQKSLPEGAQMVNVLMDLLHLAKDPIYRRIRGEISFTFEELAILTNAFNISIDSILEVKNQKNSVFEVNIFDETNPFAYYKENLEQFLLEIKKTAKTTDLKLIVATNSLIVTYFDHVNTLLDFRMFKWMLQTELIPRTITLSEFKIPDDLRQTIDELRHEFNLQIQYEFIMNRNIFSSFAREVAYLAKADLISQQDIYRIKEELLYIMNRLEAMCIAGIHPVSKKPINFYLSNTDIDATYYYWENDTNSKCDFALYFINYIVTTNKQISSLQKRWIESYKRSSTSITQTGDIYRHHFFASQKKEVKEILKI